jgi:2-polyprenyl-3-methyl-5-hydroxy-6-metoxy-1,4-benzoquinol methylase
MDNHAQLIRTWDKESGSYDPENYFQPDYQAFFFHLYKCFQDVSHKKVLEVGSGTGLSSAFLALKGAEIHLLDISQKSLDFSKKYFQSQHLPVNLHLQDAYAMKFAPASFDFVYNSGVIEHFTDPKKVQMIQNMWRLVKPGGQLFIAAPNAHDFPFMLAKKILQLRHKWSFGAEDDLTISRLDNLAKMAGLKKYKLYAYNPVVGLWFFPYGRELTDFLGLNNSKMHQTVTPLGHIIILSARKTS